MKYTDHLKEIEQYFTPKIKDSSYTLEEKEVFKRFVKACSTAVSEINWLKNMVVTLAEVDNASCPEDCNLRVVDQESCLISSCEECWKYAIEQHEEGL